MIENAQTSSSAKSQRKSSQSIAYSAAALRWDLQRVRDAWRDSQKRRNRGAIYVYIAAVFELVAWWSADGHAKRRAHEACCLSDLEHVSDDDVEPFATIIRCTASRKRVDAKTRSKWSRALRYALAAKSHAEGLQHFVKKNGGIN